ncbi:SAM-dependent DNA methyltransferase [Candidatus Bathyarchaeota archaeon]|nr:MAG: SAM-dependent DNA methyltransferase [Candidatus Bathyarchaeota archaeon]
MDWSAVSRLEDWVRSRYLLLVEEFGVKEFTTEDVDEVLRRRKLGLENVNKLLAVLRREGLVEAEENPADLRKNIYRLVLLRREVPVKKAVVGKDELIRLLKSGADLIRTAVDYKVLLLFLFYKTVSDKWHSVVDKYVKEGFSREEAYLLANSDYLTLYDDRERRLYSWREITRSRETIKEIANAMIKVSRLNEGLQDFQKLVEVLGLLGFISEDNMHILEGLVQLFNQYDFSEVDYDAVGDAYQWVLYYFAPVKAKEGETYTPREVIKLIVRILDIEDGSRILDPACGSGAMLIEAYNYVRDVKLNDQKPSLELFGQEHNEIMVVIAKMNLILHGVEGYQIFLGNSLTNPRFERADYVIANPPWNQDGYDESNLGEPSVRRIYSCLGVSGFTPKSSADWAWIQLMAYYANRKVGVVLDSGALFRGGREGKIRRAAVEMDLIDAVILLPAKFFYNTGAPGIVLVLDKNKPVERKGKILFINASEEYETHPEIRRLNRLGDDNIKRIVEAYRRFEDVEGFVKVVSVEEIRANDYNLNVTLYVFPKLEEEEIDLAAEVKEFERIEAEEKEAVVKAINYVREILEASQK